MTMTTTQNLTTAAKRELAAAAKNGGITVNSLRNGPRTQLLEAGYAERIPAAMNTYAWELRLTDAGWEAAGMTNPQAKPHTQNGEWCECPDCADPLSR
jgi:hypothetical protein